MTGSVPTLSLASPVTSWTAEEERAEQQVDECRGWDCSAGELQLQEGDSAVVRERKQECRDDESGEMSTVEQAEEGPERG